MSANTSIQWTDRTWNPVRGCSRVSPGCDNCYAMGIAHRFSGPGKPYEGLTRIGKRGVDWAGSARLVPKVLAEPLRWRKAQRIFVNSMSDLFHESLSDREILAVFGVMQSCGGSIFQVLTKRASRMHKLLSYDCDLATDAAEAASELLGEPPICFGAGGKWPPSNVWLGVSVESPDQVERIEALVRTAARTRFVSFEPLLEHPGALDLRGIDWAIVGGESGPRARPFDVAWARSIREQCRPTHTAFFLKQRGSLWFDSERREGIRGSAVVPIDGGQDWRWRTQADSHGGDWDEWPPDLRQREFPA